MLTRSIEVGMKVVNKDQLEQEMVEQRPAHHPSNDPIESALHHRDADDIPTHTVDEHSKAIAIRSTGQQQKGWLPLLRRLPDQPRNLGPRPVPRQPTSCSV